ATVFAGSSDFGGLFRSNSGGASWTRLTSNLNLFAFSALAIDPQASTTIYAAASIWDPRSGTLAGIFRSIDRGATWTKGIGSPGSAAQIVVDPTDSRIVYAAGDRLYKSANSGASWGQLSLGANNSTSGAAWTLALDPLRPATLYAVVPPYERALGAMYKST